MIQLFHSPTCPYSRRVRLALELAGADYQQTEVPWERDAPAWYTAIQASGTVPLLVIDGTAYPESHDALIAIDAVHDLGFKADTARQGTGERSRWITEVLLQDAAANTSRPGSKQFALRTHLEQVESWLDDGPFLGGDRISYLDVLLSSAIGGTAYTVELPRDLSKLRAWQQALRSTKAFQKVPESYQATDLDRPQELKHRVVDYFHAVDEARGDFLSLKHLFTEDFQAHWPAADGPLDPEAWHAVNQDLFSAFPDFGHRIGVQIGEGQYVFTQITATGVHEGAFHGVDATGIEIAVPGTAVHRFEGDRIAEYWVAADFTQLMQDLQQAESETTLAAA